MISIRRVFMGIAFLSFSLFCVAGVAAYEMRETIRERILERAEFEVTRFVVTMNAARPDAAPQLLRGDCSVGELLGGSVASGSVQPSQLPTVLWQEAHQTDEEIHILRSLSGEIYAARADATGRVYWGYIVVSEPGEFRRWRWVGAALAAMLGILAVLMGRALWAVSRGTEVLRTSIGRLEADLGSVLPTTGVVELAPVAAALTHLADRLLRSQQHRAELTQTLARKESLARIGEWSAAIAHEIRNPLAAIKLRTDLARESNHDADSDLAIVAAEVDRLDQLLTDLLRLSRTRGAERGALPLELGRLVQARLELHRPLAIARGLTLTAAGEASALLPENDFVRAIDNLLQNALEAARTTVSVEVRASLDAVEVSVRDDGHGMSVEFAARAFEPFVTTKPNGSGLGLALVRAFAETHRGHVTYCRDADGSLVTLRLHPDMPT
jgi:signal transduction histidine kinase